MAKASDSTKQANPKLAFSARSLQKMTLHHDPGRKGFAPALPAVGQADSARKRTAEP
jgi:hypothetical protein